MVGKDTFTSRTHRRRSHVRRHASPAPWALLAEAYAFPPNLDGTGQTIGVLEFGGGFHLADLETFCQRLQRPVPSLTVVEVGGARNSPAPAKALRDFVGVADGTLHLSAQAENSDAFQAAEATAEVTMDLQVLAALAPGAHLVVYFAPGGEDGLYRALLHAVHDEKHRPDVLSISWSLPEHTLSPGVVQAVEDVLREAATLGITVCASTGDAGALNGATDGKPSVNFPASSPHCLACGGTSGNPKHGEAFTETVWNATHHGLPGASGGGYSDSFPQPAWQTHGQTGRGIPDVAGLADPRYGCELVIGQQLCASAGTSAVAPLWAALVARCNQGLGRRCGYLHPHLYAAGAAGSPIFKPILEGNNGLYQAGKGWNPCTGYGTPHGELLLQHLRQCLPG